MIFLLGVYASDFYLSMNIISPYIEQFSQNDKNLDR